MAVSGCSGMQASQQAPMTGSFNAAAISSSLMSSEGGAGSSSPERLGLHQVVAALSIHCRHGYSTASATLPTAEPPAYRQPLVILSE
ncbi:hypothetical protein KUCAC02_029178 [Chaenocephalus aceratus]|uniref:Uncharacterized protein n=1 Tax=Chaenocephalus aceratus TaxID=36190 RepID=A0ACB9X411_CHAAC|nr:hypothetical protein KUCAC02_029178 [Chaenocephalus aceratus]